MTRKRPPHSRKCRHCGARVWLRNGEWTEAPDEPAVLATGNVCKSAPGGRHEIESAEDIEDRLRA